MFIISLNVSSIDIADERLYGKPYAVGLMVPSDLTSDLFVLHELERSKVSFD